MVTVLAIFVVLLMLAFAVLALNAWLLSVAVPLILLDPSNWGAWLLVLGVVWLSVTLFSKESK